MEAKDGESRAAQVEMMLPGWSPRLRAENNAAPTTPPTRLSRVSRLMALAIKFQEQIARGELMDYADIARLGYPLSRRQSHGRAAVAALPWPAHAGRSIRKTALAMFVPSLELCRAVADCGPFLPPTGLADPTEDPSTPPCILPGMQ
jgi:hypothetical protein